jgi:hypothetical protein
MRSLRTPKPHLPSRVAQICQFTSQPYVREARQRLTSLTFYDLLGDPTRFYSIHAHPNPPWSPTSNRFSPWSSAAATVRSPRDRSGQLRVGRGESAGFALHHRTRAETGSANVWSQGELEGAPPPGWRDVSTLSGPGRAQLLGTIGLRRMSYVGKHGRRSVRHQRTISTRRTHALSEAPTKLDKVPARIQYNPPPEPARRLQPPPTKASAGNRRIGRFPSVQLSGSP